MQTPICLSALLMLLPVALMAQRDLVVNDCEDASVWQGVTAETQTVHEGSGAVRWVPTQEPGCQTSEVPTDWTAGNTLAFWMHSAKATGSSLWLIISSENPDKEGIDYYNFSLAADWEGWREIIIPFEDIGYARSPVGWHKIDRMQFHCSWDKVSVPSPEDVWIFDDFRVITLSHVGPRMTDEEFFEAMDLDAEGLAQVKAAVQAGDYPAAKARFREYFLARRDVQWFDNWWERPAVPDKRPNTARADETIEHIYNFDRGRYELGPDIDWSSNQRDEGEAATIEWNAALNRHFFFSYLASAYWDTLEDKYAAEIAAMMTDWIEDSPLLLHRSGNGPYHYAWETLNTAVRAGDTWIDAIWRTADAPAWTPDALCLALKSLVEHARHLRRWHSRGNWLTAESKALTIVGTLLPEMRESEDWRTTGMQRLYNQMHEEIYPDGIENELALGYGLWVLRNYSDIYDLWLLNNRGDEIPEDYKSLLERMYNYLLYATAPDGRVPGLNDSGHTTSQSYLQQGFAYFPRRTDFQWGATRGAEGTRPEQTSYAFDYSGHYVMRSDWEGDARFLFLDSGPWGSGHQHEDKLTFYLIAHGQWWIVEGGSYMYDKSRWRRYVLSTRGHNTARVDGQDQNRRAVRDSWVLKPPFEPLGNPWVSNDAFDYVSGEYDNGYGPEGLQVTHRREVLFVKPDYWIMVDTFTPADEAAHDYETIFHISADDTRVNGTRVSASQDEKRLDIAGFGDGLSVEVVKGIEEEPVQGWANYPWRPVPTALYRNAKSGPVRNAYVLYPSRVAGQAPEVELVEQTDDGGLCLRIALKNGHTHYFTRRGRQVPAGESVTLGPVRTDAELALVKLGADGKVAGVCSVGGTQVEFLSGAQ